MKLNSVISLGSHCEPGIRYRSFFESEPYSPFDWLITYPIQSLLDIFEDDGLRFGDGALPAMDGNSALCTSYGCLYHHEFERDSNGKVLISDDGLKSCKTKLQYKYNKMIEIARNSKPLFIRWVHRSERPSNSSRYIFSLNEIIYLRNLLISKIHHENFHLAFIVTINNKFPIIEAGALGALPNISLHSYDEDNPQCSLEFWNSFFVNFGFSKCERPTT